MTYRLTVQVTLQYVQQRKKLHIHKYLQYGTDRVEDLAQ